MELDTEYLKNKRQQVRLNDRMLAMARLNERAHHVNKLLGFRLKTANELARLSYLASGTLHDIATPLTTLILNLEHLKTDYALNKFVERAFSSSKQIEKIVSSFRNEVGTSGENKTESFNIYDEIVMQLDLLKHNLKKNGVRVVVPKRSTAVLHNNKTKFTQLILNLLTNAIDAHKNSDKTNKSIEIKIINKKDRVKINIKDNGCGINEKNLKNLFKPFYTTKKENGLGLGLYICKEIAEKDFGGTIKIESKPKKYTKIVVDLYKKL